LIRRATFRRSRQQAETSLSSQPPALLRSRITRGPGLLKRMLANSDMRAPSPGIEQCHARLSLPSAPSLRLAALREVKVGHAGWLSLHKPDRFAGN
jgi:hypothetical protein